VIAQVILRNDNKYFLHKQVDCGEKRLNGLCPLFIGGHIEEFDQDSHNDIIETALLRELDEEVVLNTSIVNKEFLGLVYVYANEPTIVNKVHFGLVYIFDLKGQGVHVKEDGLEDIGFVTLNYLKENEKNLTPWSRLIIKFL
jgi:predicted NUDIX family phosphoesterase